MDFKNFLKKSEKKLATEIQEDEFHPVIKFYYDNSPTLRNIFDKEYDGWTKKNDFFNSIMDDHMDLEEVQNMLFLSAHHFNKIITRDLKKKNYIGKAINKFNKSERPKFTLITLTLEEDDTMSEDERMVRLNLYRRAQLDKKKVKYMWSEEKASAESNRYHQHIIAEGYFHTKKNLRPTLQYSGNINCKPVDGTPQKLIDYVTKETKPKGDVEYIINQLRLHF